MTRFTKWYKGALSALVIPALVGTGCTSIHETYYIGIIPQRPKNSIQSLASRAAAKPLSLTSPTSASPEAIATEQNASTIPQSATTLTTSANGSSSATSQASTDSTPPDRGPYGDHTNLSFFKFEVCGSAMFSKTRYESGWYDANAVDQLFAEVSPPADDSTSTSNAGTNDAPNGITSNIGAQDDSALQSADPVVVQFGPEGRQTVVRNGKRLVIFMSSDPHAVVSQIQALVNSNTTSQLAEKLAGAHAPKAAPKPKAQSSATNQALATAQAKANTLLANLSSAKSQADFDNIAQSFLDSLEAPPANP